MFAESLINEARLTTGGQTVVVALLDTLSDKETELHSVRATTTQQLVDAVKYCLPARPRWLILVNWRVYTKQTHYTPQDSVTFS